MTCVMEKRKKLCRQWKPLPTFIKERSHFGTEYRKAPPPQKERKKQWGSRELQAWPETGSWWGLIIVLERARLVWTSLAAKFTECTWSLEASFSTLWESRPSSLKGVIWSYPRWAACSFPLCQSPCDFSPQNICLSSPQTGAHSVSTFKPQQQQALFFPPWSNCFLWAG